MKISIRLITAGLLALGLPLAASAQTITITAQVNSQCNMAANQTAALGVVPGTITSTFTPTAPTVSLTCNKGATVSLAVGNGLNFSGGFKRLASASASDFINYNLTVPSIAANVASCPGGLPGTEWNGTNLFAATNLFQVTGGPKTIPICVSIPATQYPSTASDYQDVLSVTLTVS